MSRRGTAEEKTAKSDPIYRNRLVNMLVNRILKHGKKSLAYQIFYRAAKKIQQKTEKNPLSVLRQAIRRVTPDIAVKARRVSGSTHQVPIEIGSTQGKALAIRWLLAASRKRPGRNMAFKLSSLRGSYFNGNLMSRSAYTSCFYCYIGSYSTYCLT